MGQPLRGFPLSLQQLESRDLPSTVIISESFETVSSEQFQNDWSVTSTQSNGKFLPTGLAAATGARSLASTGSFSTAAIALYDEPVPADAHVSLKIRGDSPAPITVITHASADGNRYLAARLHPSRGTIELIEVNGSRTDVLAGKRMPRIPYSAWYNVKLSTAGDTAKVELQRGDTKQFLDPENHWQSKKSVALQAMIPTQEMPGFVSIGRGLGGYGMAFVDDFQVEIPTTDYRQNFDDASTVPDDWQTWSSDNSTAFRITDAQFLSPNHGLAVDGGSRTAARAWHDESHPADVQASISLRVDSLIPASLFVRGQQLDSTTPSYYALTITRGMTATLSRVVDGQSTSLATIQSKDYFSQKWLRATLTVRGDQLQAVLFRTDTQQWLGADGLWRDFPEPALSVTDNTLSQAGFVGLNRAAQNAGRVVFDDFEVVPAAEVQGPTIEVTASQPGNSFSGEVSFMVTEPGTPTSRRIEFKLDGELRASFGSTPAHWELDSQRIANGSHTLVVRAIDVNGNTTVETLEFTTANANVLSAPTRPTLPRHYDHIRIAQLAYSSTPFGAFEDARLKDSVDLVIPNPKFLERIDNVAPETPQAIYTNISNLYQGLLLDWLNYADTHGNDRELAFYHVTKPTPFTGGSPSSQPVTWLWNVTRSDGTTNTDLTSASQGGRSFGVALGGSDSRLSLGYPDRFAELNFDLSQPAGLQWDAVIEYPTQLDNTIIWKPLSLLNDGTKGMAQSGRISFDPPSDWVATILPGSDAKLFSVRLRTVAGTDADAPIATTILGRDYVQANGEEKGIIPVFDSAADRNGDGYLNATEFANRKAGDDARFDYESRLFYPFYGQMRFVTNPASSAVAAWAGEYHKALLQANPLADGLFIDNSNGRLPFQGVSVMEPTQRYNADAAALVEEIWRSTAPGIVIANTAGARAEANPIAKASTGVLEEFLLRSTTATWSSVQDVAGIVNSRLTADSTSPYVILDSHPGSLAVNDPRVQIGTLAYYYLLNDPNFTFLMFHGGFAPSASWSKTWIPAVSYDVGQPLDPMKEFAIGTDPQNSELIYKIYGREYSNALSLYKPLSYNLGKGTGTLDDATATTHSLDQPYRILNPDGTLGATVTQVTLRNGEGVVLIKN